MWHTHRRTKMSPASTQVPTSGAAHSATIPLHTSKSANVSMNSSAMCWSSLQQLTTHTLPSRIGRKHLVAALTPLTPHSHPLPQSMLTHVSKMARVCLRVRACGRECGRVSGGHEIRDKNEKVERKKTNPDNRRCHCGKGLVTHMTHDIRLQVTHNRQTSNRRERQEGGKKKT